MKIDVFMVFQIRVLDMKIRVLNEINGEGEEDDWDEIIPHGIYMTSR